MIATTQQVKQAIILYNQPASQFHNQAIKYLSDCLEDPNYLTILLSIFQQGSDDLKQHAFIFFTRAIKNTWTDRGYKKKVNIENIKPFIKQKIIKYLGLSLTLHPYGTFKNSVLDAVLKISHTDYPSNWEDLHNLGLSTLQDIPNNPTQDNIWILRVFRKVWKMKARKYMGKEKQFQNYAVQTIKRSYQLSTFATKSFTQQEENDNMKTILTVSRYADSIVLNCLQTMNKTMQDDANVADMIKYFIYKLGVLCKLFAKNTVHNHSIQKNIKIILQNMSNFQSKYPFVFHSFLSSYFTVIMTFLVKIGQFKIIQTSKVIITACTKIFHSLAYYYPVEDFKASIYSPQFKHLQPGCNQQFYNYFNQQMINNILKHIIEQALNIEPYDVSNSIDEEQSQGNQDDQSLYLLICGLIKAIMKRFRAICLESINSLLLEFYQLQEKIQINFITILLVVPKIYERQQIPINQIWKLLQYLSNVPTLLMQFSLIINRYCRFLVGIQGQQILNKLINIVLTSTDIEIIFEAALAIKKVLGEQTILDLSNLHQIVSILISLISKADDPSIRWYLVQLTGTIVTSVQFQSEFIQKCINLPQLQTLCREQAQQTFIYSTCDMLVKFLSKSSSQKLTLLVLYQIQSKITNVANDRLDNPQVLYNLWVQVMKRYKPSETFDSFYISLFQKHCADIEQDYPFIYCDIISYYILYKLITPSLEDIVNLVIKGVSDEGNQHSQQVKSSYLELFLIYCQLDTNNLSFPVNLFKLVFEQLQQVKDYGTIMSTNILRSSLVSIVNLYLTQNIVLFSNMFSQINPNWMSTWLQNTKSLHSKYAFKLNSLALITMFNYFTQQHLTQNINSIIRSCVFHLDSAEVNANDRKEALQFRTQILRTDLKGLFRQKLYQMMNLKGINQEGLVSTLEKTVVSKLKQVLGNN